MTTKRAEKTELGSLEEHERLATHFAEASHKFEAPISDALSGLAEAHQQYAEAIRRTQTRPRKRLQPSPIQ